VDDWLTDAAETIGGAGLSEADADAILDLARIAAHESGDRRNAPLLCYLVGVAVGRGADLETIAARFR
jgi:hypothetical protein